MVINMPKKLAAPVSQEVVEAIEDCLKKSKEGDFEAMCFTFIGKGDKNHTTIITNTENYKAAQRLTGVLYEIMNTLIRKY